MELVSVKNTLDNVLNQIENIVDNRLNQIEKRFAHLEGRPIKIYGPDY